MQGNEDANAGGMALLAGLFEAARLIPSRLAAPDNSIPLTILSGFLGVGKTTLVNRLLADPEGRRILVLVNDFGAIDIDARLISARGGDTISLANGCVCCTVSGDLTKTLVKIAQSPDRPDVVLLEPSGLADPHAVIQIALANPALRPDGVITIIDGDSLLEHMQDATIGALIRAQAQAANVVVLNKTDLIGERIERVRRQVADLAGERPVVETSQARVAASIVFGVRSGALRADSAEAIDVSGFVTRHLEWRRSLERASVEKALAALPGGVLRAKGIFHFHGETAPSVYHRVGARGSWTSESAATPDDARSQLVVIALRARELELDQALHLLESVS